MVVDDEPALLTMVAIALTGCECGVLQASTAAAAIEATADASQPIDLVISDFQLPEMNGTRLAAELKRLRPSLQFVFMTGSPDAYEKLVAEGHVCLRKPFDIEELKAIVLRVKAESREIL